MFDVIVVGGGPAGAAAAKLLVAAGMRVMLCERGALPREKSCSGILIKKSLELIEFQFGSSPPEEVHCTPRDNNGMRFVNESGREYRFDQPGRNIWRSRLDHWLCLQAEKAGVWVRDRCQAVDCRQRQDDVRVEFADGSWETAKFLIVCEGAAGVLRRKLTGSVPKPVYTWQCFCNGSAALDPHFFHAYLRRDCSDYDAWCNVKDGQLVIGVASPQADRLSALHQSFVNFLKREAALEMGNILRWERWVMPLVEPGCPLEPGRHRILFAGEAAGLLNPMGEGISSALASGAAAAVSILEGGPEAMEEYRELLEPIHQYMLRQWRFVAGISGRFAHMR